MTKVLNLALATLSLKGGAATGGALAQGLLVTGPATYYAAILQLAITGEEEEGRKAAVTALMQVPAQALPLSVVLDSLLQVCASHSSFLVKTVLLNRLHPSSHPTIHPIIDSLMLSVFHPHKQTCSSKGLGVRAEAWACDSGS